MSLFLRLAWRNIWRHRRRTLIVVLAISLNLALMMFYDGLVAGFDQAIYANAVKVLGGNIQVHAEGYRDKLDQTPLLPLSDEQAILEEAKKHPNVLAAARRIKTGGLATSREGAFAVSIVGIEPEVEQEVSLAAQNLTDGRYLTADDEDVVFIGKGLADAMSVQVGDRITLVGRAAHEQMRRRKVTVAGIYNLGLPDTEKRTIYMSLGEAQTLYDMNGQSTEIAISLKQLGQEPSVLAVLRPSFPAHEIDSWETNYPELAHALETKGGFMNIFSVIILVIAGIGILNMLLMAVFERTREIGIMGALGLRPGQVSLLFLLEGAMVGVIGLVAGIALGLFVNLTLGQIGMDYSAYTNMTEYTALISGRIYPTLGVDKLLQRSVTVLIVSILAAFYPAREAAHKEPAEALHYV
ncbi:MAG: ABC transporter permease [Chloroflexi bacterium]|nr:ABC transporter permease [Chloroflexota bacterium]